MSEFVKLVDVRKIYQTGKVVTKAIDGIDFVIEQGDFVAVMGPSGSGKSTCMNIIGCLDIPTEGEYFLGGHNVGEMNKNQLAEIRIYTCRHESLGLAIILVPFL